MISDALKNTLMNTLEIEVIEATKDIVVAKMPIGPKVQQPFGFLHGGASVALAETVASLGAYLNVAQNNENAFGLEINANHLRPKRDGVVTATATPLHRGRSTHVWDIRIVDEDEKLVCISRCTIAIVKNGA
jgi:1,4-dihydroxy-2-naphthoyl-CoA hydrolase